jgi:hypothetical protein
MVIFKDSKSESYDAIIFATGYKSAANKWLEVQMTFLDRYSILNIPMIIYFALVYTSSIAARCSEFFLFRYKKYHMIIYTSF